jgi:hypothetical protein
MIRVNSLSGGKTSSYIAANYPADLNVYALVCIDNHNANAGKLDKKLIQIVNDKLQKYCSNMPEFIATAEDPLTIRTMLELEQFIGSEIIWVRGVGFDEAINLKQSIPNSNKRWCTTILKIYPIFWLLYLYFELPVIMRIGYRADEEERAERFKESIKFPYYCQLHKTPKKGGLGNTEWFQRWIEHPFRVPEFVLIDDGIVKSDINSYWDDKPVIFPEDTNCQFCFWKNVNRLIKNFDNQPSLMHWAMVQEGIYGHRFHDGISMNGLKHSGVQQDLFGGFSGCQGGYCTS